MRDVAAEPFRDLGLAGPSGSGETATRASAGAFRYDVFLCHNRSDKPVVKDVADALQIEAGILFFLDEYSIPASVEFLAFIHDEMRRSAACAIFLGPHGWGPTQIQEARLALEVKKDRPEFRLIPVVLPGGDPVAWSTLFGEGQTPPYNWIEFRSVTDMEARARLTEAVQGNFATRAAGPEAVTPYYIRRQAALWELSKRADDSFLLTGRLLAAAQAQAAANPTFVSTNAAPFLSRCAQVESRRQRVRFVLALTAVVVATTLSGVALVQRRDAVRAAEVALGRSLAALAPRSIGADRNDERAALLARQAYLIDESRGGPSGDLTAASLVEVLATPLFSSVFKVPSGLLADEVSATGAYLIAGGARPSVIGPVVTPDGGPGRASVREMGDDVAYATFDPVKDEIWVATRAGALQVRDPDHPDKVVREATSLGAAANILSVSADRSHAIAVVGDRTLVSVDLATATRVEWSVPLDVHSLATSPGGDAVAVANEDRSELAVFRIGSESPTSTYPGDDSINTFTFDPAGNGLIVGERGGKVWRWLPGQDGGKRTEIGPGWPGSVDELAVSADGSMIAAASGAITSGIQLWRDAGAGSPVVVPGLRGAVTLRFTRDGRYLVSSDTGGETRYWRVGGTGTQRSARPDQHQELPLPGRLYSVVRNPRTDEFVVGGDHGVLQVWGSSDLLGQPRVLATQRQAALAQVPDQDRFLSGGRNFLLTGHVMQVAMSGDGARFATVDPYGYVVIFASADLSATPRLIESRSLDQPTLAVALSPGGRRLVVGATSSATVLYDLDATGAPTRTTPLPSPGSSVVRALAFPDDDELYAGDDTGRITHWYLGQSPRGEVVVQSGPLVDAIASLRTGGGFVVARGEQVDVIRPGPKEASIQNVSKGLGGATSLAISDDGEHLAVGFDDGAIRIWSMADLTKTPITLAGHGDYVRSVAFDRSGEVLVSVGDDGQIRSTTFGGHRLAEVACRVTWRDLTPDEVHEYFGSFRARLPTCPTEGAGRR